MMKLLVSPAGDVAGYCDPSYEPQSGYTAHELPPNYTDADFEMLVFADGVLMVDAAVKLAQLKAARIAAIKTGAAAHIESTDWRLQRAREREAAGWASLAEVDAVLAQREAVRRSSDAAEAAVLACTTATEVAQVQWSPDDVAVPPPCRATHAAFLDALNDLGDDVIPAILAARDSNPALLKWWTYFDQAQYISGTDPRLAGGLHGLEFAGLLPEGGAAAVLAKLNQVEVSQP